MEVEAKPNGFFPLDVYELIFLHSDISMWQTLMQISPDIKARILSSETLWKKLCYMYSDDPTHFSFDEMRSYYGLTWHELFKAIWTFGLYCHNSPLQIDTQWYKNNMRWIRDIRIGSHMAALQPHVRIISVRKLNFKNNSVSDVTKVLPGHSPFPLWEESIELGLGNLWYNKSWLPGMSAVNESKDHKLRDKLGLSVELILGANEILEKRIENWEKTVNTVGPYNSIIYLNVHRMMKLLFERLDDIFTCESFSHKNNETTIVFNNCTMLKMLYAVGRPPLKPKNDYNSAPPIVQNRPHKLLDHGNGEEPKLDIKVKYTCDRVGYLPEFERIIKHKNTSNNMIFKDHISIGEVTDNETTQRLTLANNSINPRDPF